MLLIKTAFEYLKKMEEKKEADKLKITAGLMCFKK